MRDLPRLTVAELLKAASIRSTWGLAVAGIGLAVANLGVLLLLTAPSLDREGLALLALQPDAQRAVLGAASRAALFALIIGVIASTGEMRHRTWSTTLLGTPQRWPVLLAKVKAMAVVGILLGGGTIVVLEIVAQVALMGALPVDFAIIGQMLLGTCLALALYTALGTCLGALVRGQVAAIVIVLVGSLAVEPLISLLWPEADRWLPGSAVALVSDFGVTEGSVFLQALGVLVGWTVLLGFAASVTSLRRDVT